VTDVLPLRVSVASPPADSPLFEPSDHDRLIDREEFARRLAIGVSTFDKLRAAGRVGPQPIRVVGVRFHLPEVVAWIATPAPNGELLDSKAWPAVWVAKQKKPGHGVR
jgi:hypothetical protein